MRVKQLIQDYFFSEKVNIRLRLLYIILAFALFSDAACLISNTVNHIGGNLVNLVLLGVIIASIVIAIWLKNCNLSGGLLFLSADFLLFPWMFFKAGGIDSGMPIWMLLSTLFTWLMMEGIIRWIVSAMGLLSSSVCFYFAYIKPELVIQLDNRKTEVIDVWQSFVLVTIVLAIVIAYHLKMYDLQKKTLENQRKQLEDALENAKKADKAKSDFLANMSHEIRTPINAILGMDELILRESHEKDTAEFAGNIQSSGKSLLSLINDILDFSKIESGKMEINVDEYDFSNVLNDVYNLIITRSNEKNLKLTFTVDKNIPSKLSGDEIRIRQIITNLLTNAVKYTKEGSVTLEAKALKSGVESTIYLQVSVKDTGIGISEENISHMFESFQRVDQKNNRSIEGTGLGLAITKQLVDLMNGTISVESTLGKGSVFTVKIPQVVLSSEKLGEFQLKSAPVQKEFVPLFTAPEARILVVDDVVMNLKVMTGLLKKSQIQIDTALSGYDCIEMAKTYRYDVIFLDYMMPKMDGVETFRKMKALGTYLNSDTPVVMLTANAVLGAKEEYLEDGFTDYLAKPIKYTELEEMLKKYIPQEKICMEKRDNGEKMENTQKKEGGFINRETGLKYCAGDEDLYKEILAEYSKDDKTDELSGYLENQDFKSYCIKIHALKSASLSIGAEEFSAHCKELEFAIKEGHNEIVTGKHESVMKEYAQVLKEIKSLY